MYATLTFSIYCKCKPSDNSVLAASASRCLSIEAPPPEEKLATLSDIAQEHSVEWDAAGAASEILPSAAPPGFGQGGPGQDGPPGQWGGPRGGTPGGGGGFGMGIPSGAPAGPSRFPGGFLPPATPAGGPLYAYLQSPFLSLWADSSC